MRVTKEIITTEVTFTCDVCQRNSETTHGWKASGEWDLCPHCVSIIETFRAEALRELAARMTTDPAHEIHDKAQAMIDSGISPRQNRFGFGGA